MGYGNPPGGVSFPRVLATLGVLAALALLLVVARAEPPRSQAGQLQLKAATGEPAEATIRRDPHGIPHIVAPDLKGIGFGYGYAFAEDNICTIAESYVTVRAERSRYFGPGNGYQQRGNGFSANNLNSDFFYQRIIDKQVVEKLLDQPPPDGPFPEVREGVRGYVAGYNEYLAEVGVENLSDPRCRGAAWVQPITEMDAYRRFYQLALLASQTVAIDGIGSAKTPGGIPFSLSKQETAEQLQQQLADPAMGSNAYGLGAEATDNGKGIVLANPHFPWDGPERFYQSHLTIPGSPEEGGLNVSGASLFGVPLVLIGHTDNLAWSHTVSTAYRFSPFQETVNPLDPTKYLYDGQWRDMVRDQVTVEGDPSTDADDRTRTLYSTHHGPLVDSLAGVPLPWTPVTAFTMGDANAGNFRYLNHFFEVNKAQSVERLDEIERDFQGIPWVNTIAADSGGKSYYADIGAIPNISNERANRCNSILGGATYLLLGLPILDGSRSGCEWGNDPDAVAPGIFGYDNLPKLFRDDYVTNSNDSYWLSNPEEPLAGYARIIGDERTARTLRTRIGLKMLIERFGDGPDAPATEPLDRADVQEIVFNNRQQAGELWRDDLVRLCRNALGGFLLGSSGPVNVSQACPILEAWDLKDDLDSNGAILFRRFATRALADPLGLPIELPLPIGEVLTFKTGFKPSDPVNTPAGLQTSSLTVQRAFADAVSDLRSAGIPLDAPLRGWQYERRGGEKIPIHGGPGTVGVFNAINVGWSGNPAEPGYPNVPSGSSFVMVTQFTDGACGADDRSILTFSQSENPNSPYFADQTRMFSNKEWVDPAFCEDEVQAQVGDPGWIVTELDGKAKKRKKRR